jgi:hypothetical protein
MQKICFDCSSSEAAIDLAWVWASVSAGVESKRTEARFECAISQVGAVCSRLIFQNRHRPSNRTLLSATESNTRIKTGLLRIRSLCRPRSSTQSPPLESLNRSSSLPMDIEVRGYSSESRCSRGMKKSPQSCKTKSVNSSVLTERPPL